MALVQHSSDTVEWYTPPEIIDLIKAVFPRIELDPASCLTANEIVRAERFFNDTDDGLNQVWISDYLFLNPPYGKQTKLFVDKLCEEYDRDNVQNAIMLINSNTSTRYFQKSLKGASAVCFPNKRISFINSRGVRQKSPPHSNALFYFGFNNYNFMNMFNDNLGYTVDLIR